MSAIETRSRTLDRLVPLAGVLAVVLWVVAVVVIEGVAGTLDEETGAAAAAYYAENSGAILAGSFLLMLGSAAFIWFLGGLRAGVHALEAGVGRLAAIVFGAGLATAILAMGSAAPEAAAGLAGQELEAGLEPGAAQALAVVGDGFFVAAEASVAAFYLAVGIAALRFRALPVWLGWASLVLAVAAVLPWVGWAAFIWGLPLWTLVASIWMFLRGGETERQAAAPAV